MIAVTVVGLGLPANARAATPGLPPGVVSGQGQYLPNLPVSASLYAGTSSPLGDQFLGDGDLVYDSSLDVIFSNAGTSSLAVAVSIEQYTPSTKLVYVTGPGPNGTNVTAPERVPAQLNPQWSNLTVPLAARAYSYAVVAIPAASFTRTIAVDVGGANWTLTHLTPATNSLAGLYTTGGLDLVLLVYGLILLAAMASALFTAQRFGRLVARTPRAPWWWPTVWVVAPLALYLGYYVPTNQLLGVVSPFLYPAFLAAAAWPFLPRLWKTSEVALFEGFRAETDERGEIPAFSLPVTRRKTGVRCAPETWREAFWIWWGCPLPLVAMDSARAHGLELKLEPRGLPVTCPLPAYYEAGFDIAYWYDARRLPVRTRHHLEWTVAETQPADGDKGTPARTVRRFHPHVVLGTFRGEFPPIEDIAAYLAGVRSIEQESKMHAADRLAIAHLRGELLDVERRGEEHGVDVILRAQLGALGPRDRQELDRLIDAARARAGRGPVRKAEEANGE